ncbi:MAG: hypothetical protein AB9842_01660 [Bacteroidales bacterium]
MRTFFYIAYLTALLTIPVKGIYAQASGRPLRIEFTVAEDNQPYKVIPLGKNGVMLFYRAANPNDKSENRWIAGLFDVNLKQKWTREFPLPGEYEYKFVHEYQDTVFIAFQNSGKRGNGDKASIVIIDIPTGFLKMDEEKIPEKHELTLGELIQGHLILGIKDKNENTSIIIRNVSGTYRSSFALASEGKTFLEEISPLPDKSGFILAYEEFRTRKESAFQVRSYDFKAQEKSTLTLDLTAEESTINTIKTIVMDSARLLILGAYSNQKNKTFSETEYRIEESTGFFSSSIINNNLKEYHLYNFLDFKNFFNRLRGNQSIYEGRNIKKDKELSSDYRLILHDIIKQNNEYILVGEAYYPEYHTITNWSYDYYGHMIPNYYTVFDGYKYNNAFICGFDTTGRLLWENSLEISNILTMNLRQRVNLIFDGQEIIVAYLTDGKIASKVINRNQTIDGIEYSTLENLDTHDKVTDNSEGILTHWYNNYLLAYGYQDIKNLSRPDSRRTVFYISKIIFK